MTGVDGIVARTACPACGAQGGQPCQTMIDGIDTRWTHDARVYAHMGVRGTDQARAWDEGHRAGSMWDATQHTDDTYSPDANPYRVIPPGVTAP